MLGGIVSGIWLAILGQWGVIGVGLLVAFAGAFALSLLLMPGLIFAAPAAMLVEHGKRIPAYLIGSLSVIYTLLVMTAWCLAILFYFGHRIGDHTALPFLIWAYGAATGPIAYLASKERDNEYSVLTAFASQIAFVVVLLAILLFGVSNASVVIVFCSIMGIALAFQLILSFASLYAPPANPWD